MFIYQYQLKGLNSNSYDELDDNEPFQINLYSQKSQNIDQSKTDNSKEYNHFESNQYIKEHKIYYQPSLPISHQIIEKSYLNSKNGIKNKNQYIQIDQMSQQQNILKSLSPKENIQNSKMFSNIQQINVKHSRTFSVEDLNTNFQQESLSPILKGQGLNSNNSPTLIEQYKQKYLKEIGKNLTNSNLIQKNPSNNQGDEDILTQKMQMIEQKKKKLFQATNSEIKNLKIPLIIQSNDILSKNPGDKNNNQTRSGSKKRMSLRDKPLKKKKLEDRKNSRLNKSMKTSRLSESFDLYCIYESKSEDSNDGSPRESRNRSLFFKSEKNFQSQCVVPSMPSSPNNQKNNDILNIMKEEDSLSLSSANQQLEFSNSDLVKNLQKLSNFQQNTLRKESKETNQSQEPEKNIIIDNDIKKCTDQKNHSQIKFNENYKNGSQLIKNDQSLKQTRKQIRKNSSTDQTNGRIQKNTPHRLNSSEKVFKNIATSQNTQNTLNIQQSQLKQSINKQQQREDNLRKSSSIINQENINIKLNQQTQDKQQQLQASSILSPQQGSKGLFKKESQQQIVIYDLKNSKSFVNEKQQKQVKPNLEKDELAQQLNNNEGKKVEQLEAIIKTKNEIMTTSQCGSEVNSKAQIQEFNVINLYRKSISDYSQSTQYENNQDEVIQNVSKQDPQNQEKLRNSSLINISIVGEQNNIQMNSKVELSQNTTKPFSDFNGTINRVRDFSQNQFITEDEVTQSQNNQISLNSFNVFQKEGQIQKNSFPINERNLNEQQIDLRQNTNKSQLQTNDQAKRSQNPSIEKNNQRQTNDKPQLQIYQEKRNPINQVSKDKQSQNMNLNKFKPNTQTPQSRLNFQNSMLISPQAAETNLAFKKNETHQKILTSSYRGQFKQKLEQKQVQQQNNNCYNISVYIQNTNSQISRQNSQSPQSLRKQSDNLEIIQSSQVNSPVNKKSENLRSSMNSFTNKSKPHSELNLPVSKPQQQKINLEQKKLKVINLQQNQISQNLDNIAKKNKSQVQQNSIVQEIVYDLKQKSNTGEQFFRKPAKQTPRRDQKVWSPENQGRQTTSQLSQLETQVSNLLSTKKTSNDTDSSNINDNCKSKKNIQISEFYKDLNSNEHQGYSHKHTLSLPLSLVESTKNIKNKNIKEDLDIMSIPIVSSIKSSTQQSQNNFFISAQQGGTKDLKKQANDSMVKKELIVKPFIQDSQQKIQQKKNKFNVESKVKNYIQAGQNSQTLLKIKEQPNFHLMKGAGVQIQNQNNKHQQNSKSLHQESMDAQKYINQNKQSTTMINNYDIQGNGIYIYNYYIQNPQEQSEKNSQYLIKSNTINTHKTKEQLKQSLQSSMNNFFQSYNPSKVNSTNMFVEGEQNDKLSSSEFQSQVQQQMQVQRQQAAEQIQKAQQSIQHITQNFEIKDENNPVFAGLNTNN